MRFTELYWKFAQLGGFFVALVGVLAAVRSLKLLRRCGRRAGCRGKTAGGGTRRRVGSLAPLLLTARLDCWPGRVVASPLY